MKQNFEKIRAEIIAKAWNDPNFKEKLLKNPRQILRDEYGINVPSDVDIKIVQSTSKQHYFVLPEKPDRNLSESELKRMMGGGSCDMPTC